MTAVTNSGPEKRLRRPLRKGAPVVYWQLGRTGEARYDVADRPMAGEMDPFFFRTKHKNFIPHEYPCRTEFGAEQRDRRPLAQGEFAPVRNWLPFGSPRVDLSGFWFRPTVLGTWARCIIDAAEAGRAVVHLRTCGGAIVFVNGVEIGWMAPYRRNLESESEFAIELKAGENDIRIWFDDLAERDARYYFQLDYISGPEASQALPVAVDPAIADAMETVLETMHFERPAYDGGEVALVTDQPLSVDAEVGIRIEGDFMSIEPDFSLRRDLPSGANRIFVSDTEDLPADFRHFTVTLSVSGFSASRVLWRRDLPCTPPGSRADHSAAANRRGAARGGRTCRGGYSSRAGAAGDRQERRGDRRDDRGIAAADRGLPRLRRLHPGAAALVPEGISARHFAGARGTHRQGHPRLPLLDGRARQRRAVVFLGEPRPALPHRRLSRRRHPAGGAVRPFRPHGDRAISGRRRARPRLARPFREMGNGRVQFGAVFPDRPKGPVHPPGAGAGRGHSRPRRRRHPSPARNRRPLGPSRHSDRRARAAPTSTRCVPVARSSCRASPACSGAMAITG